MSDHGDTDQAVTPQAPSWLRPGGPLSRVRQGVLVLLAVATALIALGAAGAVTYGVLLGSLIAWGALAVFYAILHVLDLLAVLTDPL